MIKTSRKLYCFSATCYVPGLRIRLSSRAGTGAGMWLILTSLLHAVLTVSLLTLLEHECGDEAFWAHGHFFWASCNRYQHFVFSFLVRLYLNLYVTLSFVLCRPESKSTPRPPLFTRFPPYSLSLFVLFFIRARQTLLTRCRIVSLELTSCH
jgi:hypothetical protein